MPRLRVIVAGGKRARCPLAVDMDPAELGMMFPLDQVVTDLVDQG